MWTGFFRRLRRDRRGNTALLVAAAFPALIGAGGLAIDTAQWFIWKQELQFATDQAAIAAAWARSNSTTLSTYQTRATQEYRANLQVTSDFASTPSIDLVDYAGGTGNAVRVRASASRILPFTGLLMNRSATIIVESKAYSEAGTAYTACMLSVHPSASGAFTLGGSASGDSGCGWGALSTAALAMRKNGNSNLDAGWLVSAGGIDSGFSSNGDIFANKSGMFDPYATLTAPSPSESLVTATYSCPAVTAGGTSTTADISTYTTTSYSYRKGNRFDTATAVTFSPARATETAETGPVNQTVASGTQAGTTTSYPTPTGTKISGNGNNSIWEVATPTVQTTVSNVQIVTIPANDGTANLQPGTYSDIVIGCKTVFAPGVYIVNGNLDFGQNKVVTGSDVMFVMKAADKITINSNSNISLTGISEDTLTNAGVAASTAAKFAGMLFFDKYSTAQWKVNGNADMYLDGILYMPGREVWFNGNSDVTGGCITLVAAYITFTGNNDLSNFCVPDMASPMNIGGGEMKIKLVG